MMKEDAIDDYVESLFRKASSGSSSGGGDAYESALRWHSEQITGGQAPAPTVSDDAIDHWEYRGDGKLHAVSVGGCEMGYVTSDGSDGDGGTPLPQALRVQRPVVVVSPVTPWEVVLWLLGAAVALAVALPVCKMIANIVYGAEW